MAAGDRNKKGKATDVVKHLQYFNRPLCGTEGWGYITEDWNDVDCKKCIKAVNKGKAKL